MKDKNILICVGIIIYIAMSGIDRFVYHIPNIIYIPVAVKFIDNQTKSTQVSQYELVLHKDSNWKIVG